ncbi:hypothetical protein F2P81_006427 [Scophthalmus maximus]|uniref:CCHC-type domain-containing protein n=1 Tax=Scophthalmus maximus TaxID=52904 RepID=A0A6A4T6N5_SCOMX|nr:hypothetical protein F2P81_006427 [Scophthalmus maximus]
MDKKNNNPGLLKKMMKKRNNTSGVPTDVVTEKKKKKKNEKTNTPGSTIGMVTKKNSISGISTNMGDISNPVDETAFKLTLKVSISSYRMAKIARGRRASRTPSSTPFTSRLLVTGPEKCFGCGDEGHVVRACPEENQKPAEPEKEKDPPGRCLFRQYMPSKPAKYGIKSWVSCDARSSYAWKMQVYTGKPTGGAPEKNQGIRVALHVTEGLRGHNVTCDNFFTSYELGQRLLRRGITMVGTTWTR